MRESYERYRRTPKIASTAMIDQPIIFLKGFTKTELMAGVILFVVAIYVSAFSLLLTLAIAGTAYAAPFGLRKARLTMPANAWCHWLWYLGGWNSPLPKAFHRPRYTALMPSGEEKP